MLVGRHPKPCDELDLAISMLGRLAEVPWGARTCNRGNLHLQRNDVGSAEHDFAAPSGCSTGVGLHSEAAMSEHNLGYTRLLAGDLVGALRDMDRARDVLAPLSAVSAIL